MLTDSTFKLFDTWTIFHVRPVPFMPCFPAFFDLLISLGQWGFMILRLKGGPTLGARRGVPY